MEAKLFSLIPKDALKGAIMAALMVLVNAAYTSINAGTIPTDVLFWKHEAMLAAGAMLAYLMKNYFTNSKDEFATPEPK